MMRVGWLVAFLASLAFALSAAACGGGEEEEPTPPPSPRPTPAAPAPPQLVVAGGRLPQGNALDDRVRKVIDGRHAGGARGRGGLGDSGGGAG